MLTESGDLIENKKRAPRVLMRGHSKAPLTSLTA